MSGFDGTIILPTESLRVHGSLVFGASMTISDNGTITLMGRGTITGAVFTGAVTILLDSPGNTYSLAADYLQSSTSWLVNAGTLDLAGFAWTVVDGAPTAGSTTSSSKIVFASSRVEVSHSLSGFGSPGLITWVPDTSHITMQGGTSLTPHNQPVYDYTVNPGSTVVLGALGSAHNVVFDPGSSVVVNPGFVDTFAFNSLSCAGTSGAPIAIDGATSGPIIKFASATQIKCSHTTFAGVHCVGVVPCLADEHSKDGGGNANLCFGSGCSAATYTPTEKPTMRQSSSPRPTPADR